MPSSSGSLPLKILIKTILNIVLIWVMATYLPQYFVLTGGFVAVIIIGALLTLLNLFLRPVLSLLLAPLSLFASLVAAIILNGVYLWIVLLIVGKMNPLLVTLQILGVMGWIVTMSLLGLSNWVVRGILK